MYRGSDTYPKEEMVYNVDGSGGILLRDKDDTYAWGSAADSTRERRDYFLDDFEGHDPATDINGDGEFDIFDVLDFLEICGDACP